MRMIAMHLAGGVIAALCLLPHRASAEALAMQVSGAPVVVFDHGRDACEAWDIPDAPARAVRTADGQVLLFAPHFRNRVMRGADLLHLRSSCAVVFAGAEAADPAAFDDRGWLAAPFTRDGVTLYAVVHDEFQGHRHPGLCPSGRYMDCWYNALTLAVSRDGGRTFTRLPGVVAALPYRYDEVTGAHRGYFNPSNIVTLDGHQFMMAFATQARAQAPGNCLLRTDRVDEPGAWRGWDGAGFEVAFINPYHDHEEPAKHVCAPVGVGRLRWPVTSLVRHRPSGLFVATMQNAAADGGVFVSTSPDLRQWSEPASILSAAGQGAWRCGMAPPLAYPSILDASSTDPSFASVDSHPELFLTRFNAHGCDLGSDRDLIRFDLAIVTSGKE